MKKKFLTFVILSLIVIGHIYCQENDTLIGKIVQISNPCLDDPCLPGTVLAIENDTSVYIITLNSTWQWADNPLIINGDTLSVNDSIKAIGIISIKTDLQSEVYYEIEIDTTFFLSTYINQIIENDILTYPNPSNGLVVIKSDDSDIIGVEIFNVNGKRVYLSKNKIPTNNIEIKKLKEKGLVILKIETINNQIITKKVLIQ